MSHVWAATETPQPVEVIPCAELLRRVCGRHGWTICDYGDVIAVNSHGLWEMCEPLDVGWERASELLLERLLVEGFLR